MKIEFMVKGNPQIYQVDVHSYSVNAYDGNVHLFSDDTYNDMIGFIRDVVYFKELEEVMPTEPV
jgi:hypothetical protein